MNNTLKEKLNFYAFLSLNTLDDDLYPHSYYGRKNFSPKDIRGAWRKCLTNISKKKAPEKLGLYIHLPFCFHKCQFCSCDSYVPKNYKEVELYLKSLEKEILFFEKTFKKGEFTSVYFGGGTPSFLKIKDLKHLFELIFSKFKITADAQIIFEANPLGLNEELIKLLAKYKTTRLTIGVQSFDKKVLKKMNRPQTKEQFLKGCFLARKYKIPFINIDLMAGLPYQSVNSFLKDLHFLLKLRPDMVHVFSFIPLKYTSFIKKGGNLSAAQIKNRELMVKLANDILAKYFSSIPHEVMGKEGAENIQEVDMRRQNSSLLGLGYGSQSHIFGYFWYQHPETIYFKEKPNIQIAPFIGIKSSLEEEMRKFLINNLQTGFDREIFLKLFGKDILKVFSKEISDLVALKKISVNKEKITSSLIRRREVLLLLKHFYSPERIKAILKNCKNQYNPKENYLSKFNYLYTESD